MAQADIGASKKVEEEVDRTAVSEKHSTTTLKEEGC